jgi:hypothetical protein
MKNEASKPNPALAAFKILVGAWTTTGTHPLVPGKTFHGRTTFEWMEGGSFMVMRSQIDEPEIPSGISIFGSDDSTGEFFMLYFDERGVSRKYDVSLIGNVWKWWRLTPEFSQRFEGTISENGNSIIGKGQMSKEGNSWEGDLELTYQRVTT